MGLLQIDRRHGPTQSGLSENVPAATTAPPPTGYNIQATHHSVHLFRSRTGFTLAFIGPTGLLAFAGLKRRSFLAGGSLFALLLLMTTAAITGCSSSTT